MRPANTFETSVNLSYDDKRGNKCHMKEPKSLHATMERAYVSLQSAFSVRAEGDDLFLETTMPTPCDRTLRGGLTRFHLFRHHHFGHDFEHWPLANSYMVNAALQPRKLPTPDLE